MNCHLLGTTRVCTCTIPYFKEIIVIAFTCEFCLHRETEVKTGGGIPEKGKIFTIKISKPDDLNRDLFKSETAEISIPELGLEVVSGSLGGVLSTVEGILEKVGFWLSSCSILWRAIIHLSATVLLTPTSSTMLDSSPN